eukprot:m.206114 g.206114  ORF g.206114 m.206114 type:complete len:1264 (-) comp32940_c0_seq3:95-3886(-)
MEQQDTPPLPSIVLKDRVELGVTRRISSTFAGEGLFSGSAPTSTSRRQSPTPDENPDVNVTHDQFEYRVALAVFDAIEVLAAKSTTIEECHLLAEQELGINLDGSDTSVLKAANAAKSRFILEKIWGMKDSIVVSYLERKMLVDNIITGVNTLQVIQEIVVNFVVRELRESGANLRVIFKFYDKYCYGNLVKEQFAQMLKEICASPIRTSVVHFLFECIDVKNAGQIGYGDLFNRFKQASLEQDGGQESWGTSPHRTIRSVAIITRHGARFPKKVFPKNAHWPKDEKFWASYGGTLTPVGVNQQVLLGKRLRNKYIETEGLMEEHTPELPSRVHAYTSNQNRTLMSAQSLLLGMFAGASISIFVDGVENINDRRKPQKMSSSSVSICMSMDDFTPLLHGFKANPTYDALKTEAFARGKFVAWAEDDTYTSVVEKLWHMTGFENISPVHPMVSRLHHMQSVAQQLDIERAHQMELLLNSTNHNLVIHDEEIVFEVAEYLCRLRYSGHTDAEQREMSRLAAGLLPAAIVHGFAATMEKRDEGGQLTLYSAHDNTIMAMLAHLGFKNYPIPKFAAHIVFELHEIDGVFKVKVLYNNDPEFNGFAEEEMVQKGFLKSCDYLELPQDEIVDFAKDRRVCNEGMDFADFKDLLMTKRQSFCTPEQWRTAANQVLEKENTTQDTTTATSTSSLVEPKKSGDCVIGSAFRRHVTQLNVLEDVDDVDQPKLLPFTEQVAGHPLTFLSLGEELVAKPVVGGHSEQTFYRHLFPLDEDRSDPDSGNFERIMTLAPYLPQYFGDIFVCGEPDAVDDGGHHKHTGGVKGDGVRSRSYKTIVPPRHMSVQLSNKDLLPSKPLPDDWDTCGWALKRVKSTSTWVRRWMLLRSGVLYWYQRPSSFRDGAPLGKYIIWKYCKEVLLSTEDSVVAMDWPKVSGVGLALMDRDANRSHGLYFESFEGSLRWIEGIKNALALGKSQPSKPTKQRRSSLTKSNLSMLEPAERPLSPTRMNSTTAKDAEREPGQVFMVLENLLTLCHKPCVLDLKIGTRQHGDDASEEKKQRAIAKCKKTTSGVLGIRCCGMKIYREGEEEPTVWDKDYGKRITVDTFTDVLKEYFDTSRVSRVKVMEAFVNKLQNLYNTLKRIDGYRFYSSSLLLIYDGAADCLHIDVRMIDFARVQIPSASTREEGPDPGALLGVSTLIDRIKQLRLEIQTTSSSTCSSSASTISPSCTTATPTTPTNSTTTSTTTKAATTSVLPCSPLVPATLQDVTLSNSI